MGNRMMGLFSVRDRGEDKKAISTQCGAACPYEPLQAEATDIMFATVLRPVLGIWVGPERT